MGQYWKLVNLDKGLTYGNWGKLREFLPPSVSAMSYLYLLSPHKLVLLNLPVEIIQEIYSHLDAFADIVCLSATCQALWAIGRRNIYREIVAAAAAYSWVGDRIICVGDYLWNDDIPKGLLTAEEKTRFLAAGPDETLHSCDFPTISSRGFDLYEFWSSTRVDLRLSRKRRYTDAKLVEHLCGIKYTRRDHTLPPAGPTVLRNISRHQYVRGSALRALKEKYTEAGIMRDIGWGEVVVPRICCSSDDGDIQRGVWAGDRFDIVEESTAVLEDAAWSDVSDEVLKEVEAIWKEYHQYELPVSTTDTE
ncbi:hypothetical protein C8R46DRAFT_1357713 [Mycena filopes]|nr:hypothetical protein C8R46DRAFT_1357713 [Mycena filopes]